VVAELLVIRLLPECFVILYMYVVLAGLLMYITLRLLYIAAYYRVEFCVFLYCNSGLVCKHWQQLLACVDSHDVLCFLFTAFVFQMQMLCCYYGCFYLSFLFFDFTPKLALPSLP